MPAPAAGCSTPLETTARRRRILRLLTFRNRALHCFLHERFAHVKVKSLFPGPMAVMPVELSDHRRGIATSVPKSSVASSCAKMAGPACLLAQRQTLEPLRAARDSLCAVGFEPPSWHEQHARMAARCPNPSTAFASEPCCGNWMPPPLPCLTSRLGRTQPACSLHGQPHLNSLWNPRCSVCCCCVGSICRPRSLQLVGPLERAAARGWRHCRDACPRASRVILMPSVSARLNNASRSLPLAPETVPGLPAHLGGAGGCSPRSAHPRPTPRFRRAGKWCPPETAMRQRAAASHDAKCPGLGALAMGTSSRVMAHCHTSRLRRPPLSSPP